MSIWAGTFWKATLERAVATVLQAALAAVGVDALGIHQIDWLMVASIAALAGVLSVAKSVAAGASTGSPSIGHVEELADHGADGIPDDDPRRSR